jgi:RNA polymerase subunit RPABC4/transcription elongation factor Spt4
MSPAASQTTPCPWCSAAVPTDATTCPSCGAQLREAAQGDILGVTQIDPAALTRSKRIKPSRLTAWVTGERATEEDSGGKIEPPSEEVRREMLRLELAAIDAELEARAQRAAAERASAAGAPPPDEPGKADPG